jgi:cysteine desulfurase
MPAGAGPERRRDGDVPPVKGKTEANMRRIYLDNNATTKPDVAVVAAMMPFFAETFANASSGHGEGKAAAAAVRVARRKVQALLGAAHEEEIVFTSGGTEANNAALAQACEAEGGRNELIVSAVEHPAILAVAAHLEKTRGIAVHRIGVDGKGRLDVAAYARALGPKTALVSIQWANNETGTLFPVAELAKMAHRVGAPFHTDAVQAAGKVAIDVEAAAIDMLSLSGHKFHGPKGIGVLYLRRDRKFAPLIRGGRQERARRAGTENVPAIAGIGAAAELAILRRFDDGAAIAVLRDAFEAAALARSEECFVVGDAASRVPNTSCLAFDGAEAETILHFLDRAGISASAGSACAAGGIEPSHVLRAMQVPASAAHGTVRFSLSHETSAADIAFVLDVLPGAVAEARKASLFAPRRRSGAAAGTEAP